MPSLMNEHSERSRRLVLEALAAEDVAYAYRWDDDQEYELARPHLERADALYAEADALDPTPILGSSWTSNE